MATDGSPWRPVVWCYAALLLGYFASLMVHATPVSPVDALVRIATCVVGTWLIGRAVFMVVFKGGFVWIWIAIIPAALLCLLFWLDLLLT